MNVHTRVNMFIFKYKDTSLILILLMPFSLVHTHVNPKGIIVLFSFFNLNEVYR